MTKDCTRRDFMKVAGAAGVTAAAWGLTAAAAAEAPPVPFGFSAPPLKKVRVGYVGVGGQGSGHVRNLLNIEGVEIRALCDIVPEKVERAQKWVVDAGFEKPVGYTKGPTDFKRLCEQEDLDLVYTATPWRWHVPVCVSAMKAGKHAATEVPAAFTLDGCWELVETSEKTKRHCVMMENCCYGRDELLMLNLVRKGMLGEIVHGEGGYEHDLRAVKFSTSGEGLWRRDHAIHRNGNLYPTHGLGPIAQCMNINRGDQFDFMVSMSSKSRGLQEYQKEMLAPDDPRRKETYKLGDVNTSLIRTKDGKTIIVKHDCNLPRPYSRIDMIQGTKGVYRGYPEARVHIEGRSQGHSWESIDAYREEFDHPLYKKLADPASGAGHGGMDYIEDYRLIKCLREGTPTDMDVYDAAAWSVIGPLSEISVENNGKPVDVPDFTRGQWKVRPPLGIISG